jgi:hydrogenase nickel incorporation protein HypA/HybF
MRRLARVVHEHGANRALAVTVRLGALSHISARHFRHHFEQAAAGTVAEGTQLTVIELADVHDPAAADIILESVDVGFEP